MHGALRTGRIKKPNQVQDLYIPVQKSYKRAKWWNSNKSGAETKPAKDDLKEHFKQQVKQIWQVCALQVVLAGNGCYSRYGKGVRTPAGGTSSSPS